MRTRILDAPAVAPRRIGGLSVRRLVRDISNRTTYLAPFRHLDALGPGDRIVVKMPYGPFTYAVEHRKIVLPTALWVTRNVGYERLVLSACNPLYSAAQRIIIFARLKSVKPFDPAQET